MLFNLILSLVLWGQVVLLFPFYIRKLRSRKIKSPAQSHTCSKYKFPGRVGTEVVRGSRNLFLPRGTSQWKGKDQKSVRKKGDLLMGGDPTPTHTPPPPTPSEKVRGIKDSSWPGAGRGGMEGVVGVLVWGVKGWPQGWGTCLE